MAGVTPSHVPAHNGEALPAPAAAGNAVGSPLPFGYDPVTTDPDGVTDSRWRGVGVDRPSRSNLSPAQYAGPRSDLDIPSYVSGYFDGEGCFTVSISPRSTLRTGWEVRPSASVSQNAERRQVLDLVLQYFLLRLHSSRSKRQDAEVGKSQPRRPDAWRASALPSVPDALDEAARLRALRRDLWPHGRRRSSGRGWLDRDSQDRRGHEPERNAKVRSAGDCPRHCEVKA